MKELKISSAISLSEVLVKCLHGNSSMMDYDMVYVFDVDTVVSDYVLHTINAYMFVSSVLSLGKSFAEACSELGIMVVGFLPKVSDR